jgi:hypothetical protein
MVTTFKESAIEFKRKPVGLLARLRQTFDTIVSDYAIALGTRSSGSKLVRSFTLLSRATRFNLLPNCPSIPSA